MDAKIALAKHYALRAMWAVLPAPAKIAVYKAYRATRRPISFN
jgi:hypothetical protein